MTVFIHSALVRYRVALQCLDTPNIVLTPEQVLEVLLARDALHNVLKTQEQVSVNILLQVTQLDSHLKQKADKIFKVINLSEYRESLPTPPQDWWWYLDNQQVNWLVRGLTVITWTGSLGLLANIASRFLSGGVGVLGAAAVVFPSFLTLLQARSELTDAGQESFDKFIKYVPIFKSRREEVKFGSLLALFGLLFGLWLALPLISQKYNERGLKNYNQGELGTAEENYLRAIALNPDNVDTHYNLGNLYEDLQEFDKARTEYLIAIKGNVPEAYNNLARLFIQKKEYSQAVALLNQGIIKANEQILLTNRPILRWNEVPGTTIYKVILQDASLTLDWKTETNKTQIEYQGETPLKPGSNYSLTVETDQGKSSAQEEGVDLSFTVLDTQKAELVRTEIAQLKQLKLSKDAEDLGLAYLYQSYDLKAEAIDLLEALIKRGNQSVAVYQFLGDLHLQIGLNIQAKSYYLQALELAKQTENIEGQAKAQEGLGEAYYGLNNKKEGIIWLKKSKDNYTILGDKLKVEELEKRINS